MSVAEMAWWLLLIGFVCHKARKTQWWRCRTRRHRYEQTAHWYPNPRGFGQTTLIAKCVDCGWWYTMTYDGHGSRDSVLDGELIAPTVVVDMGRPRTQLDFDSMQSVHRSGRPTYEAAKAVLR